MAERMARQAVCQTEPKRLGRKNQGQRLLASRRGLSARLFWPCRNPTLRKNPMNHVPTTFGFSDTINAATLEIKAARLQFSQQVHQSQMGYTHAELTNHEAATKPRQSPRDPAQPQELQLDLLGTPAPTSSITARA